MAPVGVVRTLYWTMNCSLTMFSSPVSRLDHLLEWPWQVIARSRICLAHHASEAQHDAALVGRDDEDAAERVHQQDDRYDEPRIEARRSSVSEAVAQLVEEALDIRQRIVAPPPWRKFVRIGHGRARC